MLPDQHTFPPGKEIDDKYLIDGLIGNGGMGAVYKAHHKFTERTVALKVMHPRLLTDGGSIRRFQTEGRATGHLRNDHIVEVLDFGIDEKTGQLYMAMELLEGQNLADLKKEEDYVSLDVALPIFRQIALALQGAHNRGILHRDLKPSNVMLITKDGKLCAKVVDFGIAKISLSDTDAANYRTMTNTGEIFGSPLYMSPEQCRGDKGIDQRSDIYSFGCLMYEVLTGSPPIQGNSPVETLIKQTMEIPKLPEIPGKHPNTQAVQNIIMKCLEKDPSNRFQSATELLRQLDQAEQKGSFVSAIEMLFANLGRRHKHASAPAVNPLFGFLTTGGFLAALIGVAIWQSGIFFSIPESQRQIAMVPPKQFVPLSDQDRDEQDQVYQLKASYAKRMFGESSKEYFDACVKAGDFFFKHGDYNYAVKYFGPASVTLDLMGAQKSEEGAQLYLKQAQCTLPVNFQPMVQLSRLLEAREVFDSKLKDDHWTIQLFQLTQSAGVARFLISKESKPEERSGWLKAADLSYIPILHEYDRMTNSWTKQYAGTLIPILIDTGDYFFQRAQDTTDNKDKTRFLDLSKKAYTHLVELCDGKPEYSMVGVSALNYIGEILFFQGQMQEALEIWTKALNRLDQAPANSDRDKSRILFNVSQASLKVADFGRALYSKLEAQRLWH